MPLAKLFRQGKIMDIHQLSIRTIAMAEKRDSLSNDQNEKCPTPNDSKVDIFPQIRCTIASFLAMFLAATVIGWSGGAVAKVNKHFNLTSTEVSLVVSLANYGSITGNIIAGKGLDILGRRKMMLLGAPIMMCAYAVIGLGRNVYMIFLGRFMCGTAAAILFTSSSIYASETCQASLRGRVGSFTMLSLPLGVLTAYSFSGFFDWHISAFLCTIPPLFVMTSLFFVPESPYWYLIKGNPEAATETLIKLRGPNYNIKDEVTEMIKKLSDVGSNVTYGELLNRRTWMPFLIALFLQTLNQICGANIIMNYTSTVFHQSQSSIDPNMATIYAGIAQLAGGIVSIFVIDKFGRRIPLLVSIGLCGIFMSIFGGYFLSLSTSTPWPGWSPLILLLCFLVSFCSGSRTIPWLITTEIFNTSIRSRACSLSRLYNRVLSLIILQTYPFLSEAVGDGVVFLTFGGLCFLFTVGVFIFIPETKGKSLEEIQEYFEHSKTKRSDSEGSRKI